MSAETGTRSFEVGARLRVTHVYSTRPNQTHEGTIAEIEPAGFDDRGGPFPPYVVLRDESGKYLTSFPLAYDGTRIEYPESYQVEFLDAAPSDPPAGVVTDRAPAPVGDTPQDHGPLAATLSERTLAKVLSRPAYVPRETPSLVELDREEAWLEYARHVGISDEAAKVPNLSARLAFMAGWNAAVQS